MRFVRRHVFFVMFLVSLAINFAVYSNTLTGEFVHDDWSYVRRKELYKPEALVSIWAERGEPYAPNTIVYRPLSVITWVVTFNLFGANVVPFHVTNIFLHSLVTFLLFVVVRKLFASDKLAIFSTLLFAVLPIHTENVANIKGRDDIIAALFILLGTFFLQKSILRTGKISLGWLAGSYISFLLSLFSKEASIFMIGWYLVWFRLKSQVSIGRTIVVGTGYFIAIAVLLLMRKAALREASFQVNIAEYVFNPLSQADFATRIWTNSKIVAMYIVKTFIPYNLTAGYQFNHLTLVSNPFTSGLTIVGIGVIAILIFALLNKRLHKTPVFTGLFLFLFAFIPLPKILFQASDIFAERWMYLPSAGLCIIAGFFIYKLFQRLSHVSWLFYFCIIAIYTVVTFQRNQTWHTYRGFLEQFVRDAPNNVYAHTILARYYLENGDIGRAKEEAASAYSIYPNYARLRRLAGRIAVKEEKYEDAYQLMYDFPQLHTYFTDEHFLYAYLLSQNRKYGDCVSYIRDRYGQTPPTKELSFLLGVCYVESGDASSAARYIIHDEKQNIYISKD